ncbi:putative bifunctional diguanylate cyclase/phosphodiesterase [Ancylobacter amanitiformis]|uniref:Diguanylate cyclase (GGDEF)-like protein n=1 Tax=Ancylobacter amanitiformis TaxID=217069 RepID=A0ABU0LPK6_9HYPH|nr:bifunctional diguanylate cyclase/phosphodiesterase [Ancylobacter amanitiformis]MDQ0510638.1 diguanylate cyclase (GGDEF)-like protein [Ancylobacter amanitiformis]
MRAPTGRLPDFPPHDTPSAGIRGNEASPKSDRTILAVAMVIAAAIAAMVAFSLIAAERVDAASRARWAELMLDSLQRRAGDMERDLASFAHWDESVLRTAYFLDTEWVHENFGQWLHETQGHDRSYVVLEGGLGYASVNGTLVKVERAPFDSEALMPLVRGVQAAFLDQATRLAQVAPRSASENTRPRQVEPIFRAGYLRIEGRPALVGAISITPDYGRVVSPKRVPPVAVTVIFLDGDFLRDVVAELHVTNPAVSDTPPSPERLSVAVPFHDGAIAPAWLNWEPENPGAALLRALLPALLGTAVLLLVAAAIILFYARRANREIAASEALATRLAYIDSLSGLANRSMLMRALAERLPRVTPQQRLAVLFLDLDGFKDINDTLGHYAGDLLLAEIGKRLNTLDLPGMLAARFGGDEFVLLATVGPEDDEVAAIGAVVLDAIRQPVSIAGQMLVIGGSIGATIAPDHGTEASQLIRRSDIAVYRSKSEGRGALRLFVPSMERELIRRRDLELELKRALGHDELTVYYQPQFSVSGEVVVGFEALVRWIHPLQGLISPGEFIPVAEQTGLITELDMWVLRRACAQARDWGEVKLAVNLSPVDFRSHDLAGSVAAILRETGFPPQRLEIEITENLLFGNHAEAFAALSALRSMGIRIALDDFGSGYSSLGYIRRFRVDTIKIDRSFTQNISQSDDAAAIIDCVVRLARALAITVTAEGVETRDQLRYLQSVGCHYVQGFLLASPVPFSSIDRYLERAKRPDSARHPRLVN